MASDIAAFFLGADYHPTGGNAYQVLDFWKRGSADGQTYPTLVYFPDTDDSNFGSTPPRAEGGLLRPSDGLPYLAYQSGFNVAWCSYTVTDDSLVGDGLFGAAEHAEKDSARVAQFLRFAASSLAIDTDRIFCYGVGSGATALAFSLLGPDTADAGSVNLAERESSRYAGGVLRNPVASYISIKNTTLATHFSTNPADTIADVDIADLIAASITSYVTPSDNAALPVYALSDVAGISTDYVGPGYPIGSEDLGSFWNAATIYQLLVDGSATFAPANSKTLDHSAADSISLGEIVDDTLDWVLGAASMVSAEEKVVRLLEAKLRTITFENGYLTDVKRVYRFGDPDGSHGVYPAIMVTSLRAKYDDGNYQTRSDNSFDVGVNLTQEGWAAHERRTSTFIADVRKALSTDIQLGGNVDKVQVVDSVRYLDRDETGDHSGAALGIRIGYLEQVEDPYALAPC